MTTVRLGYLLKKFPRLSETFILNEILRQEQLGAEVHVFSRRPPDDEPRHPQLQGLRAACEVLPGRRQLDPWKELFGPPAPDENLLGRFGAMVRDLAGVEHPRLSSLFAEALFLRRRCQELGIEHLHVHFATDSALTALILRGLGGPTYSITAHAKDIYRSTVDRQRLARVVGASEFTVTVCDANVRHLQEVLPTRAADRVRRLYNGLDLDLFRAVDGADREAGHILSVGRLVEKKGFSVLVEALGLLRDQGVSFQATIVGDGEEREPIQGRIAALGLEDRVRLAGPADQGVVRDLLSRCSVFCLPCLIGGDGNRDALPTVLLEALAMRVPVVSTPVGGVPEILDQGRAGVLVPERDPAATATALKTLLEDAEVRRDLGEAGRRHAEECFDGRRVAATLNGWFQEVLAGVAR